MNLGWLKTVGRVAAVGFQIATGIDPLLIKAVGSVNPQAGSAIQKFDSELIQIGGIITTAETMFAAVNGGDAQTGAQKLAAVTPFISTIIKSSELMVGKEIADEAGFIAAVQKIAGGFADLLNSLKKKN